MLLPLPRRLLLPLLGTAVALAVLLGAVTASAQAITLSTTVTRNITERSSTYHPTWINYSDCIKDGTITFTVSSMPSPAWNNDLLQVWASSGTDCNDSTQRTGSAATCWEVYSAQPTTGTGQTVKVSMRDIVGQHTGSKPGSGTIADCNSTSGTSSPQAVTLYFMLISGAQVDPTATTATYNDLKVDLLGPDPPTKIKTGIAEKQLKVSWTPPASSLTDVSGYYIFCDPKPGSSTPSWTASGTGGSGGTTGTGGTSGTGGTAGTSAGGSDAGSVDAAADSGGADAAVGGSGAGGASGAAGTTLTDAGSEVGAVNQQCPSTVLLAGQRPDPAYICGKVNGASTTSGYAKGLTNGQLYAVAVAGFDGVENYGPLSEVQCETPQIVNDFWDEYTQAGGKGGGGFCGIADSSAPGAGGAFLLALFAGFLRKRRRQRS